MAISIASSLDPPALLVLLADGQLHSGESLARTLGVSRAAVWKGVERLRALGVPVLAVPRRGYQLATAVELLDAGRISAALAHPDRLDHLELLFDVDSTNSRLLASHPPAPGVGNACLSELQHAGRGRRGRRWIAPFGSGLALSLGWAFRESASAAPSLSLGVGVAVARALGRVGAEGIALKWPNDIWLRDQKIGGVLIELRAEASGPAYAVIGVGINVSLPETARLDIEASGVRVAAVADACDQPPSRNLIAAALLDELLSMLALFERDGFAAYREAWTALDALRGRPAAVSGPDQMISGIARGVDADGALLLETGQGLRRFVSGELSLRAIEGDV